MPFSGMAPTGSADEASPCVLEADPRNRGESVGFAYEAAVDGRALSSAASTVAFSQFFRYVVT